MTRIDFLISNNRHHVAMFRPVVERLAQLGHQVRVVSLCELRGLASPLDRFSIPGVSFIQVVPSRVRRIRERKRQLARRGQRFLGLYRELGWQLILRRRMRSLLLPRASVAVVPNDAAYPFDRICAQLRSIGVPILLVQEGIRYPVESAFDPGVLGQGRGGASAIAVWGEASAEFFAGQGVPRSRIFSVGNPRFDEIDSTEWAPSVEALRRNLTVGRRTLVLLTNPIELHGLATLQEKMAIVRRFVEGIGSLFADPEFHLIIKLHSLESSNDFRAAIADLPVAARVRIATDAPLYPLLAMADAVVILATTAGLESLLFSVPLGVLEIPDRGFVHDYVSRGAALGLLLTDPLDSQVRRLLSGSAIDQAAVDSYIRYHLATRQNATGRLVDLIDRLATETSRNELTTSLG